MKEQLESIEQVLAEYLTLQAKIKPLSKRYEELRDFLKKQKGSFSTENYVCSLEKRSRTALVALDKAIDIVGEEFLVEKGLIKISEFILVHVSDKRAIELAKN